MAPLARTVRSLLQPTRIQPGRLASAKPPGFSYSDTTRRSRAAAPARIHAAAAVSPLAQVPNPAFRQLPSIPQVSSASSSRPPNVPSNIGDALSGLSGAPYGVQPRSPPRPLRSSPPPNPFSSQSVTPPSPVQQSPPSPSPPRSPSLSLSPSSSPPPSPVVASRLPKKVHFRMDEKDGPSSDADYVQIRCFDKAREPSHFIMPQDFRQSYSFRKSYEWEPVDAAEEFEENKTRIEKDQDLRMFKFLSRHRTVMEKEHSKHMRRSTIVRSYSNDHNGDYFQVKDAYTDTQPLAGRDTSQHIIKSKSGRLVLLHAVGSVDEMYPSDLEHENCLDCKKLQAAGGIPTGYYCVRCPKHKVKTPWRGTDQRRSLSKQQDPFWTSA